MDARGIGPERLIQGANRGNMDLLAEWTATADKVLIF
jgi:sulfur relay (sulfurtransferase) complex TusBCD TusD component (DsrE family)